LCISIYMLHIIYYVKQTCIFVFIETQCVSVFVDTDKHDKGVCNIIIVVHVSYSYKLSYTRIHRLPMDLFLDRSMGSRY